MNWLSLITTLPTENATARMRAWRALKSSGAAVLRDGVYLMPVRESCRTVFDAVAADVVAGGGSAYVLHLTAPDDTDFTGLFARTGDYAALLAEIAQVSAQLSASTALDSLKQRRKLHKHFLNLVAIDFFPGEAKNQVEAALSELEKAAKQYLDPDEPDGIAGTIVRLNRSDYQGRLWATRRRPWVDRLASAWLIRRFIDPQARFLWLNTPADCPDQALGFDFDGAAFSHVGACVTFEVLLASFGLTQNGLKRLAQLVHGLDLGGIQAPEAAGVEQVLLGLRASLTDDEQLLAAAGSLFDGLFASFDQELLRP